MFIWLSWFQAQERHDFQVLHGEKVGAVTDIGYPVSDTLHIGEEHMYASVKTDQALFVARQREEGAVGSVPQPAVPPGLHSARLP